MAKERTDLKPGWVNANLPADFYSDTDYLKIYGFFVIHAMRPNRSSKGKEITKYGWPKDVWKNTSGVGLKDVLLYSADLHLRSQFYDFVTREPITTESFVSCQKLEDMSDTCHRAGVQKDFTRTRSVNRVAVYNSEGNIILSVFDHIRNALAHGRFTIYEDGFIALESGKSVYVKAKRKNMLDVRARMLLKKETLMKWIEIIESGVLDEAIVKVIEQKRIEAKEKRKQMKTNISTKNV